MAKKNAMNWLDWTVLVLLVVGGLNWGLVGIFKWDLVQALLGGVPILRDIVYILVGIAAIVKIVKVAQK